MTEEEREMDLQLADLELEVRRLRKIEQAALAVVKSFSNSIDYNTWDSALDALEAANLAEDERKEIYTNVGRNLDFNTFLTRVTQAIKAKVKEKNA